MIRFEKIPPEVLKKARDAASACGHGLNEDNPIDVVAKIIWNERGRRDYTIALSWIPGLAPMPTPEEFAGRIKALDEPETEERKAKRL